MLDQAAVVLFRPKFSENVGSAARAMANMGLTRLIVVDPQEYDPGRARALATIKGEPILESMAVAADLESALAPFETVFGTTARAGGWRKGLLAPDTAAARLADTLRAGGRVAVLFGPEDKGLTNDETKVCGRLVMIPTAQEASSLNLAQAVLIILYELRRAVLAPAGRKRRAEPFEEEGGNAADEPSASPSGPDPADPARLASHKEREALFANLKETLSAIDFLKDDNPDYWMLPVRAFIERIRLKRSEFNLLMGVCRQVKWAMGKNKGEPRP
jgi:tRNA/rRNA methyltransferase